MSQLDSIEHQRDVALERCRTCRTRRCQSAKTPRTIRKCTGTASRATFDFEPKPHWDLGAALGIIDFERATKIVRRALLGAHRRGRAAVARAH